MASTVYEAAKSIEFLVIICENAKLNWISDDEDIVNNIINFFMAFLKNIKENSDDMDFVTSETVNCIILFTEIIKSADRSDLQKENCAEILINLMAFDDQYVEFLLQSTDALDSLEALLYSQKINQINAALNIIENLFLVENNYDDNQVYTTILEHKINENNKMIKMIVEQAMNLNCETKNAALAAVLAFVKNANSE